MHGEAAFPGYGARSALLVVDVQNDFADPGGGLSVAGGSEVVPILNEHIRGAVAAGALVAYTQDWHPAVTPHFAKDGGVWPVHCVAGTWGAELHPDLVDDAGPHVHKGANGEDGYSGFTMRDQATGADAPTELDGLLRARGIRTVLIGGLATDYCVRFTALDALRLGYRTLVLLDAIRAVNLAPGDGDRAIAELAAAGAELLGRDTAVESGTVR